MQTGTTSSARSGRALLLLKQFWLLAFVMSVGLGLISAALLGANLRVVWFGSSLLAAGVCLYVIYIAYAGRRRSQRLHAQLDHELTERRLAQSTRVVRPLAETRH